MGGRNHRILIAATLVLLLASIAGLAQEVAAPHPARDTAASSQAMSTVVLVSLDGFRWDYLDWPEARNLRRLAARGVRAEGLIPAFPSKTFPCHYTLATGLYPGHHGIISNHMRTPALGTFDLHDRASVEDPRWWGGEPIWVTAERAGLVTAAMFWPGTETAIRGVRPTYWHRFDAHFRYRKRVEQVLAWLDLEDAQRPRLITLYFQDPNDTSHASGPQAPETRKAVREVDARLEDLLEGIARRKLNDRVNLVITSDHGMAEVSRDRVIVLDETIRFAPDELVEQGAFVQIAPNAGREKKIYQALQGLNPHLAVYRREAIPARFHLAGSDHVAPIVAIPEVGWEAMTQRHLAHWKLAGDHGQDPADPRMHGIFVAAGPALRAGRVIERFESIEVYNLLAALLGIAPAPNDGHPDALREILLEHAKPALASDPNAGR